MLLRLTRVLFKLTEVLIRLTEVPVCSLHLLHTSWTPMVLSRYPRLVHAVVIRHSISAVKEHQIIPKDPPPIPSPLPKIISLKLSHKGNVGLHLLSIKVRESLHNRPNSSYCTSPLDESYLQK